MTQRDSDYEELRPLGEATHIPDDKLANNNNEEDSEQRLDAVATRYPNETTATESECSSCGASIPASRTKCRFCLVNHLDSSEEEQSRFDTEWTLLHVVHFVVEASTFDSAIAKGTAAAGLLVKADRDSAVDDCQLLSEFDEEPASQLASEWPSLPEAVRIMSDSGRQLLETARELTEWQDTTQARHDGEHATFLYDESGRGIHDKNRLMTLLEDADDMWLVPAIALQQSIKETKTDSQQRERPNRRHLECRECNHDTRHRFLGIETVSDDEWSGQPMWECQVCGMPQYGPEPKADQ
jgi:ribosomal protein L40E